MKLERKQIRCPMTVRSLMLTFFIPICCFSGEMSISPSIGISKYLNEESKYWTAGPVGTIQVQYQIRPWFWVGVAPSYHRWFPNKKGYTQVEGAGHLFDVPLELTFKTTGKETRAYFVIGYGFIAFDLKADYYYSSDGFNYGGAACTYDYRNRGQFMKFGFGVLELRNVFVEPDLMVNFSDDDHFWYMSINCGYRFTTRW